MLADALTSPEIDSQTAEVSPSDEIIVHNERWERLKPVLSVVVPTFRDSAHQLTEALSDCIDAHRVEVIIYDDGSRDEALTRHMEAAVNDFTGAACLVTATVNKGRSAARNRLEELARSPWMLFLDADMMPDSPEFLKTYIDQISSVTEPMLIVGGFSLDQVVPSPENAVHRAQCEASECVPAEIRSQNPARFVFTSNVVAHKKVMDEVSFDPAFKGWGWEDVDWGVRVSNRFPVRHINNTATHLGLDPVPVLLRKYGGSGDNFWLALNRHPEVLGASSLARLANKLSRIPGVSLIGFATKLTASAPGWLAPVSVRLFALKLYRAAVYGKARHARS